MSRWRTAAASRDIGNVESPNSHNQLTNVTDWAGRSTSYSYDLAGRVTNIFRANGTSRVIRYDAAGRTREIRELGPDGKPLALFQLTSDEAGRYKTEFVAPLPQAYTEPTLNMTYDDDNRLATINGVSVVHDADGNMTSGPLNSPTAVTHSYDARNRLRAVGVSGSAPALSYGYDSEGNRTEVTQGGQTTRYVWNPAAAYSQVLVRTKPDGSKTYYVYGLGLLYQVDEAENTATYHYDYRGSTVALTSPAGYVIDRGRIQALRQPDPPDGRHRHPLPLQRPLRGDDRSQRALLHARPVLQPLHQTLPQRRSHWVRRGYELVCVCQWEPDQLPGSVWAGGSAGMV